MDLREYLVRGAVLICTNGSHKRKINLPKCHGIYAGIHPLLHELEYLTESACGRESAISHTSGCAARQRGARRRQRRSHTQRQGKTVRTV